MIRIVIFYHEVSGIFIYVVVYGTNEENTCSCTISLHHIALYIIRGCCHLKAATVPVQRRDTMQLHTLLGMEAVDMAYALNLHSW
jgi:hypothetical protein